MRVFSTKSLRFDHPTDKNEPSVTVRAKDFADVPDWVSKSAMFQLASSGDSPVVSVIENKSQALEVEKAANTKKASK